MRTRGGKWQPKRKYDVEAVYHVSEYLGRRMVDMCIDDAQQRRESRKLVEDTMNKARELSKWFKGEPAVIVHVGGMTVEPQGDDKSKRKMLDHLKKELEQIDTKGVKFYLENLPPKPWYFGGQWTQNVFSDGWEIAEFLADTGYDFCFDSSHAQLFCNLEHKNLAEYAKVVQPWTKHLHVADGAGFDGEGLQIGDGETDFDALFKVLKKNPCTIVPEVWRGHLWHNRGHILGMERLVPYIK